MPFVLVFTAHPALEVPFALVWPMFRACVGVGGGRAGGDGGRGEGVLLMYPGLNQIFDRSRFHYYRR